MRVVNLWKMVSINASILVIIASGVVIKPEIRYEGGIEGYLRMYFLEFDIERCLFTFIIFFLLWMAIESTDYLISKKKEA